MSNCRFCKGSSFTWLPDKYGGGGLLRIILFSVAVCVLSVSTGQAGTQFAANAWPNDTGAPVNSSPVLGDIDGDGVLEIVIGSDNNKVYAWKPDGTLMPGWPVTTDDSVRSSPALADLDGDGRLEVIVGSYDNKVYAWNFNGSLLAGWPVVTGSVVYSSPAVGDIDGDQRPEIVVGSFDNNVYAWNADGTLVRGWPKPTGLFVYSSPALADLDEDGLVEVIVGTDNNRVFAWNGDGSDVDGWPTATEHVVPSSPAVGDLDGDGKLDVVVGSWDKVFVWNHAGEQKQGWPVTVGHQIPSSPALADLNNDGLLDIIIGCKDGRVYAWNANGQALMGWPTITDAEIASSPAVADLNGDGRLEVCVGSKDGKIYIWDAEGRLMPGWPKRSGGAVSSSPAIGDVDGDGTLELVIGSKDSKVYAWSFMLAGSFPPHTAWQNFHGNPRHTGVAGEGSFAFRPSVSRTTGTPQPGAPIQPTVAEPVGPTGETPPIIPLEVKDGEINDLMVVDYTESQLTLSWTAPPGIRTAQTVYDIRYSPKPITEETWQEAIPYPGYARPAAAGAREVYALTEIPLTDSLYIAMKLAEGPRDNQIKAGPLSNVVRFDALDTTPPGRIEGFTVTELSDGTLEFSWQTTGDDHRQGTANTYDLRYAQAPIDELTWSRAMQVDNEPSPLPAGGEQTFQIQKPWDDRETFFAIKAIDEALNVSDISDVAVWSPRDDIPPARVIDLRVAQISGNAVTISWTAPGNNLHVGTAYQYDIRYSDFPMSENEWQRAIPVENPPTPESAGTPQQFTIEGIPIGATGYVGLKTIDRSGNISPLSNVVEMAMGDTTPPAAVTDLRVEQIGTDWVQLSWTATGDDGQEGVAAAYILRYGGNFRVVKSWTSAIDVQDLPAPDIAGTPQRVTIRGLNENSTYYVGLRVLDGQGNTSELSNILRVQTYGHSTPETVTDLAIEELRADGLTLNWTAPRDLGEETATVAGYDIRYALNDITEENWEQATTIQGTPQPAPPGTLEVAIVKSVPTDSAYYVALKSYDSLGNMSGLSNVVAVPKLDKTPPEPIIDLFVEETGRDWARITWTAPADEGESGLAGAYLIRVAPTLQVLRDWKQATEVPNTLLPSTAGTQEAFTITDLNSDSTFFIAVKSIDDFGNTSEMSNIIRAKTKDADAPARISDLEIMSVEKDAVLLEWTAPGEDGTQGRAEAYDVRYSTQPITNENWETTQPVPVVPRPAPAGSVENAMVTELSPNTRYYFAVVAFDSSDNASPLSNVISVLTSDTIAPPPITTLTVETVQQGEVLLSWISPGDDETHETPARYDLRYSTEPLSEASWHDATAVTESLTPSPQGEEERFHVTELQPATHYYLAVKAVDFNENSSDLSNVVEIFTSDDRVTDLEILDFSGQSVTLTWTTPGGDLTGGNRNYQIRYATVPITEDNWQQAIPAELAPYQENTLSAPGSHEKFELTELPPYEQLFFAVKVAHEQFSLDGIHTELSAMSNVVELNRIDIIPPGNVTDLQIADLGAAAGGKRSLQLSWSAPGDNDFDGTAAQYEVRYGATKPTEENWETLTKIETFPEPMPAGTSQTATIQVTEGEDTLYFALKCYDEAFNSSGLSNVAHWAPDDFTPPARVTDLQAERINNGEDLRLTWTAPGDNEDRGVAAFYDIRYALEKSVLEKSWQQATVVTNEPLPETAGTQQEYVISGVRQDMAYYIALTTTDDAKNTSELSNIAVVEEMPPDRVDDLAFVGGTDTSITVSWSAPQNRVPTERIVRYEVRYSQERGRVEQWRRAEKVKQTIVPGEPGSVESLTIDGLEPNSRYYVAVRAEDHTGELCELSNIVAAYTTDTIPPHSVKDLTVQQMTAHSVTLSWTSMPDDQMHEVPEYYEVRYSLEAINEGNWMQSQLAETGDPLVLQPTTPGEPMQCTVSDLLENTTYYFYVQAIDFAGNRSNLSNIAIGRTQDVTPPEAIHDLHAIFPTASSVMLTWTSPADVTSGLTRTRGGMTKEGVLDEGISGSEETVINEDMLLSTYDIRYLEVTPDTHELNEANWEQATPVVIPPKPLAPGTREEFVIRNLQPATTYYFAIRAIDRGENAAPLSNVVIETTMPGALERTGGSRAVPGTENYAWEILQGDAPGVLQQEGSGVFRLMNAPQSGSRGLSAQAPAMAVYPRSNTVMAIQQGELSFAVKSTETFMLCAQVRSDSGDIYYLCYTPVDIEGIDVQRIVPVPAEGAEVEETEEDADSVAPTYRKRIDNYVFFPFAVNIRDNEWHDVHLNLARDLFEGTGQIYQETLRLVLRGNAIAFHTMTMHGAVDSLVTDFETMPNPLQQGWKIHFGNGTAQRSKVSMGDGTENFFLLAKAADARGLVVTYPKDAISQLSDKPFFLASVTQNALALDNNFKIILKAKAKDGREFYVAYLPEATFAADSTVQPGLSGNYLYVPLQQLSTAQADDEHAWVDVQASVRDDLSQHQIEYAYTSWLSFHGKEFGLDNIRFSTDILVTPIE